MHLNGVVEKVLRSSLPGKYFILHEEKVRFSTLDSPLEKYLPRFHSFFLAAQVIAGDERKLRNGQMVLP